MTGKNLSTFKKHFHEENHDIHPHFQIVDVGRMAGGNQMRNRTCFNPPKSWSVGKIKKPFVTSNWLKVVINFGLVTKLILSNSLS